MTKLIYQLNGTGLYLLTQTGRHTGRFTVSGMDYFQQEVGKTQPIIFSSWHGHTMLLMAFFLNHYDTSQLTVLIPDDWRGESLSVLIKKVGAEPFPAELHEGERASMATARRLVKLVRQVKNGRHAYITPDGPEGPAYQVKPGVSYIAQKTGAPIVPLGTYVRHGYVVPRWDRYMIPYPFSRISIHIGQPYTVAPGDDLAAADEKLTNRLHRVAAQAAANYYEQ